MATVKEQLRDGYIELKRLTDAMNGREFDPERSATGDAERPYASDLTQALLDYCFGNVSEAETLRAMQVSDPAVLPVLAGQLEKAAQEAGIDEAALVKLQARLSQAEASAPDT